jgi:hypothetical protein
MKNKYMTVISQLKEVNWKKEKIDWKIKVRNKKLQKKRYLNALQTETNELKKIEKQQNIIKGV